MRSKKQKKQMMIAIILGILATLGISTMLNSKNAEMEKLNQQIAEQNNRLSQQAIAPTGIAIPQEEKINAVSAKIDIKTGDLITINKLEKREYKKNELPPGYFPNESFILGKTAAQDILSGKIIMNEDVSSANDKLLSIPSGMRAITIPTSSIQGLASYIFVGSRVDLVAVKSPPKIIAQNVKIISMETNIDPNAPAAAPAAPAPAPTEATTNPVPTLTSANRVSADKSVAITVIVPVNSAENVIDAMNSGKIQILTRGANDNKIISYRNYSSNSSIRTSIASVSSAKLPALPPPPSLSKEPSLPSFSTSKTPDMHIAPVEDKYTVQIIQGTNSSDVEVSKSNNTKKSFSK